MRLAFRCASVACGVVFAVGAIASWAEPAIANTRAPGRATLYVSNLPGALPPAPGAGGEPWPNAAAVSGCVSAAYKTIGAAVAAASAGDTIAVCPGVYTEDVVVPAGKPLTIEGLGVPLIDASKQDNGVQVLASGTTVEGFTVGYATGEGILVGSLPGQGGTVSNVTIRDNTVIDNDQGNPTGSTVSGSSYAECNAAQGVPGDCGEGIHLLSADHSVVSGNYVTANTGGILLTDENGPTDGNLIASNDVVANAYDCGITVAGHHLGTTTNGTTWTPVAPTAGGVFDNKLIDNRTDDNGVSAEGGGILLATGVPGGAVYDNTLKDNTATGNGLAGITVHGHSPGEDLDGNVLRGNVLGTNDVDGDFDFAGNTPPAIDTLTTGIIVATAVSPVNITIVGNRIANNVYGIWMTPGVTAKTTPPPNIFVRVTTPTFTAP